MKLSIDCVHEAFIKFVHEAIYRLCS